jgi:pyridoxine 5-phosphate synthase
LNSFKEVADLMRVQGIGVNAGHDLNLLNLANFLTIGNALEVSIGHALTVECIEFGRPFVVDKYLYIHFCASS